MKPQLCFLPQVTSIAEVLCLTAFFGRLVHFAKVTPQKVFWKDTKNICVMVTIVVSARQRAFERLWSKAESMKRLGRFEWVQENDRCWESKHQRHNCQKTTREAHMGQKVTVGVFYCFKGTSKLKEKETETIVLKPVLQGSLRTECQFQLWHISFHSFFLELHLHI